MLTLACSSILASSDDEIAIAAFVMGGLVGLVSIVSHQWRKHREAAYNARLKQLMIERGMTADEIERVVQAAPGDVVKTAKRYCGNPSL